MMRSHAQQGVSKGRFALIATGFVALTGSSTSPTGFLVAPLVVVGVIGAAV